MQSLPIWMIFAGTMFLVLISIEIGFRLGEIIHRRSEDEKESPVSAISGSILGLLAFILAFTFGIVSNRYDDRKALVREEANVIGTAFLRSDFLPEPDRAEAADLFRKYVDGRVSAVKSGDLAQVVPLRKEAERIQRRLWEMAVANARLDMNSDVAALYIDALNAMIEIHATRIAVGLHARIPAGIWQVQYALILLGMIAVGYQTGIAGSKRSWAMPVLALSFSMVIALIASLDRSDSRFIRVPQQPLEDVRAFMGPAFAAPDAGAQEP